MSEGPELSETEALAAEHALGLLTAAERAQTEARAARDPVFAALVADWQVRLGPLAGEVAAEPPPASVWSAVERALPANDNAAVRRRLRFWQGTAAGALAVSAASLAAAMMLAMHPPLASQPGAEGPILKAHLMSSAGGEEPMFVAAYDPMRKALIVTSLAKPGAMHELWIIPADGKMHPIGMIAPGQSKAIPMPEKMRPMFAPGAAIAASAEPPAGSPSPGPSGPITAMGKLSTI